MGGPKYRPITLDAVSPTTVLGEDADIGRTPAGGLTLSQNEKRRRRQAETGGDGQREIRKKQNETPNDGPNESDRIRNSEKDTERRQKER